MSQKQGLIYVNLADLVGVSYATTQHQGLKVRHVLEERLRNLAPGGTLWLSFEGMKNVSLTFLAQAIGKFHDDGNPVYGETLFAANATHAILDLIEHVVDEGDRCSRNPEAESDLYGTLLPSFAAY